MHQKDYLHLGVNSTFTYLFVVFDEIISYYNTLKIKKEHYFYLFVDLSFITLINLSTPIRRTQTWYTVVIIGLNQHEPTCPITDFIV